MPTPVSSARQCLTPEAAFALDEAVSLARRRAHAQTMSLHAVSALFLLPNSSLREACAHARNSAYSPRLQFKALELSLNVSLDRIPSARPPVEEPPVSNSLMAAIKRSQANQKRHPENYHVYHQIQLQQQSGSAVSCIKVELQHLILAMLDDPVVSRVFGEAGFRSCDIKMSVIRPLPRFIGYSRSRLPPLFLSNLHKDADVGNLGSQIPPSTGLIDADVNHRRICEVLVKNKGRNPLLVGVRAYKALKSFTESLVQKNHSGLPVELSGISKICIEKELSVFVQNNCNNSELLNMRLEAIAEITDESSDRRLIVNIGDLHSLIVEHPAIDSLNHIILQMTKLLAANVGKLWLIGSVVSYEMFLKFVAKFPSIENDWDLQLLPITALRSSLALDPYSRSPSLMESFVPFGGFFSAANVKCSLSSIHQTHSYPRENNNVKDITTNLTGGLVSSFAGQHVSNLPSWLKLAQVNTNNRSAFFEAKNGQACLTPLAAGTANTSLGSLGCVSQSHPLDELKTSEVGSPFPASDDFQFAEQKSKGSLLSKLLEKPSKLQHLESSSFRSLGSQCPNPPAYDGHSSASSASSETTTLGLGIVPSSTSGISHRLSKKANTSSIVADHSTEQSSSSGSSSSEHHSYEKFKMLFTALSERFPQQREAIGLISKTVVCSRMAVEARPVGCSRGGKWLGFLGPDSHCKKKIAAAVADILWGEHGNFVFVDLSSSHYIIKAFKNEVRGKTAVDYIAQALNTKPFSVVVLGNVDKADVLVRNILSRAVKTGKFSDSHGRDVSTSNAIFFAATSFIATDKCPIHLKEPANVTETRILRAKGWAFQTVHACISPGTCRITAEQTPANKRKLAGADVAEQERHRLFEVAKRAFKQASDSQFDLNLPANIDDDMDQAIGCHLDGENHCSSLKLWLEDFMDHVHETVEFKPFDFDKLAENLAKQMTDVLHDIVGSEHVLEIDSDVMDQLLAVAYTSDNPGIVDDWIKSVLTKHLTEARTRYDFSLASLIRLSAMCNQDYAVEMVPFLPPIISFS
ncbi:unnamed protein product [Rhodiola kirilowii]